MKVSRRFLCCVDKVIDALDSVIYKWYRALARNGHRTPATEHCLAGFYARKVYIVLHFCAINLQLAFIIILLTSGHNWQVSVPAICLFNYLLLYMGLFVQKRLVLLPCILSEVLSPLFYFTLGTEYIVRYLMHGHNAGIHLSMAIVIIISAAFQWAFLMVLLRDYCRVEKETEEDDRDCFWEIVQILVICFFGVPLLITCALSRCVNGSNSFCGSGAFFRPRGRARTRTGKRSSTIAPYSCSVISRTVI